MTDRKQHRNHIMTIAYWCVLTAIILPYILAAIARLPGLTLERNLIPRIVSDDLSGVRQRSLWAHQNALEVIAPFVAAVVIAQILKVPQSTIDTLSIAFIGFRVAHALAYMANLGVLRSLMFLGGMGCIVGLFIAAA